MDPQTTADLLPAACRRRGCKTRVEFNVPRLAWGVAHWHDDEDTVAGVYIESIVTRSGAQEIPPEVVDELARVAHLPERPTKPPAHGVEWYCKKTLAEIMDG